MIFSGLCGVASAGVGFVAGSAVFKSVWRVWTNLVSFEWRRCPKGEVPLYQCAIYRYINIEIMKIDYHE